MTGERERERERERDLRERESQKEGEQSSFLDEIVALGESIL